MIKAEVELPIPAIHRPISSQKGVSANFEDQNTTFRPGQMEGILIEGSELTNQEYSAVLDNGTAVTLYRAEDEQDKLVVFIPIEEPDDYILEFVLDDQDQSLNFTIDDYEPITDPDEYIQTRQQDVNAQWETHKTYLNELVENGSLDQQIIGGAGRTL